VLLLFDIDGTLLRGATDAHRAAMHEALRVVHGVEPDGVEVRVPVAGRTDGDIARSILLEAGISAVRIDERADAVREVCCRTYARFSADLDLAPLVVPGMPQVLEWLSSHDGTALALVTGNYEAVAHLKLHRAGIGRWFPRGQGAFGSDSEDRAALPAIARRRAGRPGAPYPRSETVVIGDTPRDIACARADGLRCVAVTTGPYGADELSEADFVADGSDGLRDALTELLRISP